METREFGARLRELRIQAGLNQRELADKIGVNFTYLSKIESGVMPPPSEKVIVRLAEVLNTDRDELMTLAGKIPSDIVQILKNRETLQLLRSHRTQQKSRVANKKEGFNIMKSLVNYKRLSKVAIAAALVLAVAASLWFAAPLPVQALEISFPTLPSGTLGSTHSFKVKVDIPYPELVPIQSVDMEIYNVADTSKKIACTSLPLTDGDTASYSSSGGTVSLTASGTSWEWFSSTGYAYWKGTGYWFTPAPVMGYGYKVTGTASLEYTGTWTSPPGWPSGGYKIKVTINAQSTDLTKAFTEYSSQFTLSRRVYGEAPSVPPAVVVEPGVTDVSDVVTDEGVFTQDVTAESEDSKVELFIEEGITGLTEEDEPLSEISIIEMEEPPAPPADSSAIGLTYDLGPDGATFDPSITITFTYDPDEIPEGVNEGDLVIAMWDGEKWVELEGCTVDPVTHTITARVSHFTPFTILTAVAPPYEEYEAALAALAEVEAAMAQAEADLAAAQAQATSLQSDIDATEAEVTSVQADIAATQAQVTSLQSDLTAAQERLAAAQERIAELEAAAGLAWWVWLIIGLAAVAVIGVIIWLVIRRRTA